MDFLIQKIIQIFVMNGFIHWMFKSSQIITEKCSRLIVFISTQAVFPFEIIYSFAFVDDVSKENALICFPPGDWKRQIYFKNSVFVLFLFFMDYFLRSLI